MKRLFRSIREWFMTAKLYILRTVSYISLINTSMLLFLMLSKLKELGVIGLDLEKVFILLIVVGVIGLYTIGWFEIRVLKGMQQESIIAFNLNPLLKEMKGKIDIMYEEFERGKEKK